MLGTSNLGSWNGQWTGDGIEVEKAYTRNKRYKHGSFTLGKSTINGNFEELCGITSRANMNTNTPEVGIQSKDDCFLSIHLEMELRLQAEPTTQTAGNARHNSYNLSHAIPP